MQALRQQITAQTNGESFLWNTAPAITHSQLMPVPQDDTAQRFRRARRRRRKLATGGRHLIGSLRDEGVTGVRDTINAGGGRSRH